VRIERTTLASSGGQCWCALGQVVTGNVGGEGVSWSIGIRRGIGR
jgi:hypothetical protein